MKYFLRAKYIIMINMIGCDNMFRHLSSYKPTINGIANMFVSAVIVPIVTVNGEPSILFELRSKNLRVQPLEVCLPGGKVEANESNLDAALRETFEEIGIPKNNINFICELDTLVTPFNSVIYPFLCSIDDLSLLNVNLDEVDHIFTVPISFFINNSPIIAKNTLFIEAAEDFPHHLTNSKEKYAFRQGSYETRFYQYKNYTIWGFTARIIKSFIDIYTLEK